MEKNASIKNRWPSLPSRSPPPKHWRRLPQIRKINLIILINCAEDKRGKPNHYHTHSLESDWACVYDRSYIRYGSSSKRTSSCAATPNAVGPSRKPEAIPVPSPRLWAGRDSYSVPARGCLLRVFYRTAAFNHGRISTLVGDGQKTMQRPRDDVPWQQDTCCTCVPPPTCSQTGPAWMQRAEVIRGANGGIPKRTGRWPALTKSTAETNWSPSASQSMQEPVTGMVWFGLLGWFCFFFIFLCRNLHHCPHKLHSCFDIVNLK